MKKSGDEQIWRQPMVLVGLAIVAGVLALAGCSKAKMSAPAAAGSAQPDLAALDHGLLQWIFQNKRTPTNFDDFAATAGVTIPPPPPGQKYTITKNMRVELVDK